MSQDPWPDISAAAAVTKPITSDEEEDAAHERIQQLWKAENGTPEADIRDALIDAVVAYWAAWTQPTETS